MNNTTLLIRTAIIFAVTILAVFLVIGPRGSFTASDFSWQGITSNLENNINLGLDLKGGLHLVARVKTDEYLRDLTLSNSQAALTAAKEKNLPVSDSSFTAENGTYEVRLSVSDISKSDEITEAVRQKVDFLNWTESVGSDSISWSLPAQAQARIKEQATDQAMQIIDSRINQFGVTEPTLQKRGTADSGEILLQMPGVEDPKRVKDIINAESKLALYAVVSPPNPNLATYPTREAALQSIGGVETDTRKVYPYTERDDSLGGGDNDQQNQQPSQFIVVEEPPIIEGDELRDANAVTQTGNEGDYQISFSLKPAGATKFGEWTGRNINNYMAVILNNEAKSVAFIQSQIFDQGQISGQFTQANAEDLALTLKSGALPAELEYLEERTVGPSLGADSIWAGVTAALGGLIFVILFMLFYYRGAGVNAVVALLLNMVLTLAALIVLDATLTLPGIAGLILGIGMAVDSNVLIFERMREEIKDGKLVSKAVELGFDRAFITIIDTHVTTIIAAIILYLYGSGPIRGFAVTLILGLIINLFSAVFVSRTIFMWILDRNPGLKKLSI
ncbi:MAG: protein translocase subunit SecD [Acidobacteria bacterium]|nr:MAG: protein translocase subunit SecD [Acidobacteriota bacterium]REK01921.1 MAG: protein translocase subunit SecD [Acidobacteriota bacterium]REK14877.1 MAG: protein translocase subunit SecD [Acidobacteriota bacterium]REK45592.1 MAG: protein translocase subunit SecD [Acidobacteriota bacterium]